MHWCFGRRTITSVVAHRLHPGGKTAWPERHMIKRRWIFVLLPALLACGVASAAAGQSVVAVQGGDRAPEPPRTVPRLEPRGRVPPRTPLRPWRPQERRGTYQEPAFARGYADGYMRGLDDSRDRDRYDAVGHRDYRRGDEGYYRDYGSRDAYRNNYRAGFRQGYDEGYRSGGNRR